MNPLATMPTNRLMMLRSVCRYAVSLCIVLSFVAAIPATVSLIDKLTPEANQEYSVDSAQPINVLQDRTVLIQDAPETPLEVLVAGPTTAKVGELVEFDASQSKATDYKWSVMPETTNVREIDGGKKLLLTASAPGTYTVVVAACRADNVDLKVMQITFTGSASPEANSDISALRTAVSTALQAIDEPEKASRLQRMADNFAAVANMIDSGAITTPEMIISTTAGMNKATLGDKLVMYQPLMDVLRTELNKQADASRLTTPADHSRVWREIAEAIKSNI